jgi:uncharacterized membrane protein YoaK (UPF0700 family)
MTDLMWIRSHVELLLQREWQVCRVLADDDGDFPFRHGTAACYVSVLDSDPPMVRVFAYAAYGLKPTLKVLREINEIQGRCLSARVELRRDVAVVSQTVSPIGLRSRYSRRRSTRWARSRTTSACCSPRCSTERRRSNTRSLTRRRQADAVRSFVRDPDHGPLPALLLVLTITTGLVDAASILGLGRVFVANMTGNVVFIGFALANAPGFSLEASAVALVGFLAGAALGGQLAQRRMGRRADLLRDAAVAEAALLTVATVIVAADGGAPSRAVRDVAVVLAAVALGGRNAAVRELGVPDMTTTVLTMTLTGIAADFRLGRVDVVVRRVLAVVAMLGGAVAGALLVLHVDLAAALGLAAGLAAVVAAVAAVSRRAVPRIAPSGGVSSLR